MVVFLKVNNQDITEFSTDLFSESFRRIIYIRKDSKDIFSVYVFCRF